MSDSIQLANADFTFSDLTLANPQGLQGGAYFSKLRVGNEAVLIQTPKCCTKNGIHKTEKKIYCDLMFTEDNNDFIQWVQSLETTVKNLIYEKRNLWFHNDMDLDSIDYHWQNLLRTYKGNKSLLRCFINKSKGLNRGHTVQIYNEEEEELKLEDVNKTTKMISILEVVGLKFTSQSFQIEFVVKQMMLIKEKPLFSKCLIKFKTPTVNKTKETVVQQDSDAESDISIEDTEEDTKNNVPNARVTVEVKETEHVVEEIGDTVTPLEVVETKKELQEKKENISTIGKETDMDKETETETVVTINTVPTDLSQNNTSRLEDNLEKVEEKLEPAIAQEESLDKNGIMNEIEILPPSENTDIVKLKNPNEVYMEIYKEARRKAKEAKKHAIQSYLEAKRIKSLYLLDEIESSDDDMEFEEYEG
jgi:hypothetical protein